MSRNNMRRLALLLGLVPLLLGCGLTSGFAQLPPPSVTAIATATATATETIIVTPTAQPTCTVTAASLHLRDAGSADANVIGYLSAGDELIVISRNQADAWINVRTGGGDEGFINGGYCER